jgi:hypothetical protein
MAEANEPQDFHTIDLRKLKFVIDTIFDHMIEDLKLDQVTIPPEDAFYWEPSFEQAKDPSNVPLADGNSRLNDDWYFLRNVRRGQSYDHPLRLLHVYPLLRYLANTVKG